MDLPRDVLRQRSGVHWLVPPFSLGRQPPPPGARARVAAVSCDPPLSPAFFAAFTFAALAFGLVAAWLYASGAAVPSLLWTAPPAGPGPAWSRTATAPLLTSSGLAVAAACGVWAVAFAFGDRSRSNALVQGMALGALGGVALAALSF